MLDKLANQQMPLPLLNNKKEASVQDAHSLPLFLEMIILGMLISLPAAIPFCWIQTLQAVRQCLHGLLAALI